MKSGRCVCGILPWGVNVRSVTVCREGPDSLRGPIKMCCHPSLLMAPLQPSPLVRLHYPLPVGPCQPALSTSEPRQRVQINNIPDHIHIICCLQPFIFLFLVVFFLGFYFPHYILRKCHPDLNKHELRWRNEAMCPFVFASEC